MLVNLLKTPYSNDNLQGLLQTAQDKLDCKTDIYLINSP